MKNLLSTASSGYAAAYREQHETKDFMEALRLYAALLRDHPNTRESRDARTQIRDIMTMLVRVPGLIEANLSTAIRQVATEVPSWFHDLVAGRVARDSRLETVVT